MVFLPHRLPTPSHVLLPPPPTHPAESISVTHMCMCLRLKTWHWITSSLEKTACPSLGSHCLPATLLLGVEP